MIEAEKTLKPEGSLRIKWSNNLRPKPKYTHLPHLHDIKEKYSEFWNNDSENPDVKLFIGKVQIVKDGYWTPWLSEKGETMLRTLLREGWIY